MAKVHVTEREISNAIQEILRTNKWPAPCFELVFEFAKALIRELGFVVPENSL